MSQFVERMPVVFFGHGSPTNALGGPYAEAWKAFGQSLATPKAVLCISAHWYVDEVAVTAVEQPRTIHDFYGFPRELYQIAYPAPGDLWLAERTADLLGPNTVRPDREWGLDHGAWSVLMHVFPKADVPIVQLSIDRSQPPSFHYELGQKFAPLRDEGVLICGSGDVVHNLGVIDWQATEAFPWASSFNNRVKDLIVAGDHEPLVDYQRFGEEAALSIPTAEHYLPLLYVLGACGQTEPVHFFNDRIELASISMLSIVIGTMPPNPSPMNENQPPDAGLI